MSHVFKSRRASFRAEILSSRKLSAPSKIIIPYMDYSCRTKEHASCPLSFQSNVHQEKFYVCLCTCHRKGVSSC